MITLTRLNGKSFTLNALYIETIEAFPDTTILLTNGRRYVVKETVDEVDALSLSFYQKANLLNLQQEGGSKN
ncbi:MULTISPECIES: flagellar FlbD family protein [Bacillaceae]|uniref:flagellar FlbD family protein n=1 Tax=Bacillaceae TaxID=186817 RepID=UPI001C57E7B7|nr:MULTISPECIES: flagellar FlbD family protein [Rossellomorea]MBW3113864.1 flagellar FlbD family protein [Bacillus sp. MCCB 382]MDX8343893.1 flagellar FlbD family protein [Rossellomorea sp. YZS02]